MSSLQMNLLGPFGALLDDQPLENLGVKSKALLIYLAVERDRPHRRATLFTLLWPGMPEKSARHNLSQAIYALRKVFPDRGNDQGDPIRLLLVDRQSVQLNPAANAAVDIHQLDHLLETIRSHAHPDLAACSTCIAALEAALSLYPGDFLSDFYLEDSNPFEEWAQAVREAYRTKLIDVLGTLSDIAIQKEDYDQAITYIDRQLGFDELRERAHRQKIEVLTLSGRRVEAMRQYREFTQHLEEQLGTAPSQETIALYKRIRSEDLAASPTQPESVPPKPPAPRHNLLPQPTPFIGRQEELAQLEEMLRDPDIRLITIVAPGGMGKTRLAIACAERQLARRGGSETHPFSEGIFFIPFAQVNQVDRIVLTVAKAINLQIEGRASVSQSPKAQLLNYLRGQQMLLLVDNFEHLISNAKLLVEISQNAPGIKILVTSRERLNIQSEQIFTVGGLPSSDEEEAPEIVAQSPAAQLFTQSARRVRPDYQIVGDDDIEALSLICYLAGGMPLALELAAGWVDILSLPEIAAEIQRSLDFLKTDLQDVPARHRGIQAVFDSTWELLDQDERDVFLRFSIFKRGCTRQAAQTVTGASLRTLASLSKKSLLRYRNADGRYIVHELMRQYAAEKLAADTATEAAIQDAHCSNFCSALVQWEADLKSARQSKAVAEIQADYQNIQAAWDWAVAQMDLRNLILAARGLVEYFEITYHSGEAEMVFSNTTHKIRESYGPEPKTADAAWLLACLQPRQVSIIGRNWWGRYYINPDLELLLLQSLALLKIPSLAKVDTIREKAFIHLQLGLMARDDRQNHLEESLHLYAISGDKANMADAFFQTYWYFHTVGEFPETLLQNLEQLHQSGDTARIVRAQVQLGRIYRYSVGDYKKALQTFEDAYVGACKGGHLMGMAHARRHAAFLYWFLGNFEDGLRCMQEGLDICFRMGNHYWSTQFLFECSQAEAYRGQFGSAITLVEEAFSISDCLNHIPQIYPFMAYIYLHTDHNEIGREMAKKDTTHLEWPWCPLGWLALLEKRHAEALAESQKGITQLQNLNKEWYAWVQVPYGFALHRLGRIDKAKMELYQALQTCVKIRSFLPLMHLMPVLPVVLADSQNEVLQERALDLYAMAKTLPFVANSKLFEDIAERPLQEATAHLPQEVIEAAQSRGQKLDWWETAAALLDELRELGWAGSSD